MRSRIISYVAGGMIFIIHLLSPGCTTEPDLGNYPTVSFVNEVQPIISGNCTQSSCHGVENPEEFMLVTYTDIMAHVTPGNGRKSLLYKAITGRSDEFMPPAPSNPLTEDQIRSIFVWIEQGAQNN